MVCVFSVVVVLVTVGPARATLIVAVAVGPLKPPAELVVDSWTLKLPAVSEPVVGVNFSPAAPWARVMKLPLAIARGAVVLIERAAGDAGDLEVGRRAVAGPGRNHQAGSRLRVFRRRGAGHGRTSQR